MNVESLRSNAVSFFIVHNSWVWVFLSCHSKKISYSFGLERVSWIWWPHILLINQAGTPKIKCDLYMYIYVPMTSNKNDEILPRLFFYLFNNYLKAWLYSTSRPTCSKVVILPPRQQRPTLKVFV
jgi:hypothetical protein